MKANLGVVAGLLVSMCAQCQLAERAHVSSKTWGPGLKSKRAPPRRMLPCAADEEDRLRTFVVEFEVLDPGREILPTPHTLRLAARVRLLLRCWSFPWHETLLQWNRFHASRKHLPLATNGTETNSRRRFAPWKLKVGLYCKIQMHFTSLVHTELRNDSVLHTLSQQAGDSLGWI